MNRKGEQNDNPIRQSFEQIKQKAPNLWDTISSDLEKPDNAKNIEKNKVKESFEQLKGKAPDNLWMGISSSIDSPQKNKIKESFEQNYSQKAPQWLWQHIQKQLNIDSVWTRISKALDKMQRLQRLRRKALQFTGIVLLLLWLRGCGAGDGLSFQNQNLSQAYSDKSPASTEQVKTSEREIPVSIDQTSQRTEQNRPNFLAKVLATQPLSSITKSYEPAQPHGNIASSLQLNKYQKKSLIFPFPILKTGLAKEQVEQTTEINPNNLAKIEMGAVSDSENDQARTFLSEQLLFPAPQAIVDSSNPLAILKADPIFLESSDGQKNKLGKTQRLELGIITGLGSSTMLNYETKKAWQSTSLTQMNTRPAYSLGLALDYYLSRKDAFVFNFYPAISGRQNFKGYTSEGIFYTKDISFLYSKLEFAYQRSLFRYNEFYTVPSEIIVRANVGLGYLNQYKERIGGSLVENKDVYKKMDYSLGLAFGQTHQIKHFVLEYGIHSSMGLNNIFKGDATTPANFKPTNLFSFGAYLSCRYAF